MDYKIEQIPTSPDHSSFDLYLAPIIPNPQKVSAVGQNALNNDALTSFSNVSETSNKILRAHTLQESAREIKKLAKKVDEFQKKHPSCYLLLVQAERSVFSPLPPLHYVALYNDEKNPPQYFNPFGDEDPNKLILPEKARKKKPNAETQTLKLQSHLDNSGFRNASLNDFSQQAHPKEEVRKYTSYEKYSFETACKFLEEQNPPVNSDPKMDEVD